VSDIAPNLHEKVLAFVTRHASRLEFEDILDIHATRDSALASLDQMRISQRKVTVTISCSECRKFTTTVEYGSYVLVSVEELLGI